MRARCADILFFYENVDSAYYIKKNGYKLNKNPIILIKSRY